MQALGEAALGLFLARGLEAVTIDDITHAAGMAKGGFYRYFRDKPALVASLFQPISEEVVGALTRCGAALQRATTRQELFAAYEALARTLVGTFVSHPGATRLYLQEARGPALGARVPIRRLADTVARQAVAITHQAHTHGLLRPIPATVSALAVVGAVERLLFGILSGEAVEDPLGVPDALVSLILDGLRAPEGGVRQ
jgi:AcrR family transcriptional regulator